MPTYQFKNNTTGVEWEKFMGMSEVDDYKKENDCSIIITGVNIVGGQGDNIDAKTDSGWKDVLSKISEAHPRSELAKQYGYIFNRVFIRQQKTRWGSCSAKNNINLNLKLVLLPTRLMDYVIMHELVHTRHKNHGPLFWKELDKITGDAKGLSKKVKSFGVGIL